MSEAKHTPGPYSVGQTHHESEGKSWLTFSSQADILHPNGLTSLACVDVAEEEGEANARIFAAGPDLLEALTLLVEAVEQDIAIFGSQPRKGSRLEIAKTAIAKATGSEATP